jgi:hypothetical protein
MKRTYYGATAQAQKVINQLLSLPATGREQDWEVEFADPLRILEMLDISRMRALDLEERCALFVLILASVDELERGPSGDHLVRQIREILQEDEGVLEAMRFYWIQQMQRTDGMVGAILKS